MSILEVYITDLSTSTVTIQKLRDVFSRFGFSELIVTDNTTCFASEICSTQYQITCDKTTIQTEAAS